MRFDAALEWAIGVLGQPVMRVEPLVGATSSSLLRVIPEEGSPAVLRVYTNQEWLALEPDLASHEAAALTVAAESRVPTPELIAFDAGSGAGAPVVLMTELPGTVDLLPTDRSRWLDLLSETLATLHDIEVGEFDWTYRIWQDLERLTAPDWSDRPGMWESIIDVARSGPPEFVPRFIHRDYHPTNVLWLQGSVSGVVDWVNACWGPPAIDVAHCRLNLAAMYGIEPADSFAARYEEQTGRTLDPVWDLIAAIEWLPEGEVYPPWLEMGLAVDTSTVRTRIEQFAANALAQLD